jgi:hypothetical protein
MIGRRRVQRPGPRRDRRRTERRTAGWESRYVVADQADDLWFLAASRDSPCLVRDLSTAGACLVLAADDDVAVGSRVVLDLQLGDRRGASIRLAASIRYVTDEDGDGRVRAGLEFDDVGDLERALLFRLLRDLESARRQTG